MFAHHRTNFILITFYGESPRLVFRLAAFVEDVETDPVIIVDGLTKKLALSRFCASVGRWGRRRSSKRSRAPVHSLDGGAKPSVFKSVAATLLEPELGAKRKPLPSKNTSGLKTRTRGSTRLKKMGILVDAEPAGAFLHLGKPFRSFRSRSMTGNGIFSAKP